jgi:threonine synthase
MTTLTHLECGLCGRKYEAGMIHGVCECGGPLLARYDLENARRGWSREWLGNAQTNMWRYAPLLPVANPGSIVSLGEGLTPLLRARRLGEALGAGNLWIKNDGVNPTGTSKAREFSCVISMAVELGIRKVAVASAGNAAAALAAYAAAAGLEACVYLPRDVPRSFWVECQALGAQVRLGKEWIDKSAWQEPYRVEGAKTAGYEIAEQSRWELPDAIVCPQGDGVGLVGMWKAFEEMEAIGWISERRPKIIAVQPQGAHHGEDRREIGESGATTIAVSDQDALDAGIELAALEGIFAAPEGAACVAALRRLLAESVLRSDERIVILNPASGENYVEAYSARFPRFDVTEQDKLGGLITPR